MQAPPMSDDASKQTEKFDLFISYKRNEGNGASNIQRAEWISEILSSEFGFQCYFDQKDLWKGKFRSELESAIKRSSAVLYLATEASLDFGSESNFAALEWHWAIQAKKNIIYFWADTQKQPKMLMEELFFDCTEVLKSRGRLGTMSNPAFRNALAMIGDLTLPAQEKKRDGYRTLAVYKCIADDYECAGKLLEWVRDHPRYPNAATVVLDAQKLIQKKHDQIKNEKDYALATADQKQAAFSEMLQQRERLESELFELQREYAADRSAWRLSGSAFDSFKETLQSELQRQGAAVDLKDKTIAELSKPYELLKRHFPSMTYDQADQEIDELKNKHVELRLFKTRSAWMSSILMVLCLFAIGVAADARGDFGVIDNAIGAIQGQGAGP